MLQIALHAAAILVGVKRHNKPGCRTCSGVAVEVVPELGENWRLWVVAQTGSQSFGDVRNKETKQDDPEDWGGLGGEIYTFIW